MNVEHNYWLESYKNCSLRKPKYDLWLEKHIDILNKSRDLPIVDLGCGIGNDSLYLSEKGYDVISCDISANALDCLKQFVPSAQTMIVDMLSGLPFDNSSIKVLISDLSLHYFYWEETVNIIEEIKRVLTPDGYLLCRVNSTGDFNNGAGEGNLLEDNFYFVYGNTKRFFDKNQITKLFQSMNINYINEYEIDKSGVPKRLWEFVAQNRYLE